MNLLLISWYFPPANDVGALRVGSIADYFRSHGHHVRVLTAARQHRDASLSVPLPEAEVARTAWFDVDTFRMQRPRKSGEPQAIPKPNGTAARRPFDFPFRASLANHYRHLIRMPDQQIGWLPHLLQAGREILRERRFDLVYASAPPFTTLLGAAQLSREFGVPWIAEYRDAWSRYIYTPKPKWRQAVDTVFENRIISSASGIVAISEPWADYYKIRFRKPTRTVYNGFDQEHVQDDIAVPRAQGEPLTIVYMGVLYGNLRDPSCLYQAIKLSGLSPRDVRIDYYGPSSDDILPLAEKFGVVDFVCVRNRIPYRESLKVQRKSDVLLLLQSPEDPRNVPAKTFEYLASRRPILGLGLDDGIPAQLIWERQAGIYVTDAAKVAEQLKKWVAEKRETGTIADLPADVRRGLSRAEQLDSLSAFLHTAAGNAPADKATENPASGAGKTNGVYVMPSPATARSAIAKFHPNLQKRPLLVTTIDAEEGFDWSRPLSRNSHDVSAMGEQHIAHRVFERYGVVPIYFVTYPVVTQDEGSAFLLECSAGGNCEIGAQLHAWVTPPHGEAVNSENSFAGNLPAALETAKLRTLTDAIEARFGSRPQAYRAGRYGIGPNLVNMLYELGYKVDSSVVPEQSYRHEGGPAFFGLPTMPYWLDPKKRILELPLTSHYTGLLKKYSQDFAQSLFADQRRHALVLSAMARTHALKRIRLTPEGTQLSEAKNLVRSLLARGTWIFTVSYHAPSLVPGNTPYVRTAKDRERLLGWLDEFYTFFMGEIGGAPVTTEQLYELSREQETIQTDDSRAPERVLAASAATGPALYS